MICRPVKVAFRLCAVPLRGCGTVHGKQEPVTGPPAIENILEIKISCDLTVWCAKCCLNVAEATPHADIVIVPMVSAL